DPSDINFIGHQKQIEDLIQSIETGKEPLIDGWEGRKSVEIVLAIYESARSGKIVEFPFNGKSSSKTNFKRK
ncbi:MAG: Gfo/Idh/MocA family oxidoreductase, partial [Ginsengibacter sp.]